MSSSMSRTGVLKRRSYGVFFVTVLASVLLLRVSSYQYKEAKMFFDLAEYAEKSENYDLQSARTDLAVSARAKGNRTAQYAHALMPLVALSLVILVYSLYKDAREYIRGGSNTEGGSDHAEGISSSN